VKTGGKQKKFNQYFYKFLTLLSTLKLIAPALTFRTSAFGPHSV
jgi:hypothetical protein